MGLWLAKSAKRDEAMKLLTDLKQQSSVDYVQSYTLALIYIGLGNKEEALSSLEKEVSGHSEVSSSLAVDPSFDDLRGEPRFKALLRRMNLPE